MQTVINFVLLIKIRKTQVCCYKYIHIVDTMTWKRSVKSLFRTKKRIFILSGLAVIVILVYLAIDSYFDSTNIKISTIIDTWSKIREQHNAKNIYKK